MDEQSLLEIFEALERHGVEYAVFGAVALGLHGLPRATEDLDLFLRAELQNIHRLKEALGEVYEDPAIAEISAEELCGDYPAVRYYPPEGFGLDILTRLGDAFRFEDLEIVAKEFEGVEVRVVSPRTLWEMKKGTVRPGDRMDASVLADRFGFEDD
jgi:hypothetical protein